MNIRMNMRQLDRRARRKLRCPAEGALRTANPTIKPTSNHLELLASFQFGGSFQGKSNQNLV